MQKSVLYSLVAGLGCIALGTTVTASEFVGDAVIGIGTAATVIAAFYAALSYHRPKKLDADPIPKSNPRRAVWLMAFLVILAWGAAGFNFFDRHYWAASPQELISNYGWSSQNAAFVATDGRFFSDLSGKFKLALILRASFANIDRMTDPFIAKSIEYTIIPEAMTLAIVAPKLRINPGQMNMIEFNLVAIPANLSLDEVTNLDDVEKIGGRILESRGKSDVVNGTPAQ